jgi:photosystem II stability/assembly factor-like uncharacterized protein
MGARALLLLGLLGSAPAVLGAQEAPRAAEPGRLADRSLLTAIAAAGARLLAVGDRGIIVFSDDGGHHWTQAASVPTQALLTGVCFLDAQHGIAVGHDLVALTSSDAGRTWQRTHYAPEAQRPLLDVWCGSGGRAIAIGAYSTYLSSSDAGATWTEQAFKPAPAPAAPGARAASSDSARGEDAGGFHLNRIASASGARLYIAAEAGHLYRSDDAGASWRQLSSPYEGSFFGVLPLGADAVLAYGLRGNLYRSDDAGASWQKVATATLAMLDGGTRWGEAGVALVGLSGVVLVSRDGGHTFTLVQQADHGGLAAAIAHNPGTLVVVGEAGARVIELSAAAQAAGSTP